MGSLTHALNSFIAATRNHTPDGRPGVMEIRFAPALLTRLIAELNGPVVRAGLPPLVPPGVSGFDYDGVSIREREED